MADVDLTHRSRAVRAGGGPEPLTVSVVIATYTERRWDLLRAAVEAVQAQEPAPHELIVVVDHNPRLFERARGEFSGATVIENTYGRGDAGSANCAAARASGDVMALVDDDAVPQPGWLAALLAAYADVNVLGVGGLLTPDWSVPRPRWFPEEFLWVVGCTYRGLPGAAAPVRNLIGANMSVRRNAFLAVGGFREDLARVGTKPFAGREAEFCIRANRRQPNGRFLHEPAARVCHFVTPERSRFSYFIQHCYDEGQAKAMLARLVGPADGLSSEREYLTKILPSGIARGVTDALLRRDASGLARAAAIFAGACAAGWGYAAARLLLRRPAEEKLEAAARSRPNAVHAIVQEGGPALDGDA